MTSLTGGIFDRLRAPRPPGPRGLALARAMLAYRRDGLPILEQLIARYGDVVCVELPGFRAVLLGHPDLIHHVLITRRDVYFRLTGNRNVKRFFGNAMQLTNDDYARRMRRMMAPAFQPDRVAAAFTDLIVQTTEAMLDRWERGPRPGLTEELMDLALDITVQLHLGTAPGEDTRHLGRLFVDAIGSLRTFMLPDWAPTPGNRRYHDAVARLDAELMGRIAARRRAGARAPDLMATFFGLVDDTGQAMTDRQIRDELIAMMAAGYKSVGIAINQTLRLVAEHPDVERRLADELREVVRDRAPAAAELERLGYAQKVVKESLRCCPPAGAFVRTAMEDDVVGGVPIPAGAQVFLSAWAVHHDPRYFPEPAAFRPERWTPDLEQSLPMFAYFPFGRGTRSCIAGSLSLFILQMVLALVVRRYRLQALQITPYNRSPWTGILAAGGLAVTIEPR